jgi:vancomycin resistance protein YoaR
LRVNRARSQFTLDVLASNPPHAITGRQSMVQSLSPDLRETPLTETARNAREGASSWLGRARRLVLPDEGDREPVVRPARKASSATGRSRVVNRLAILLPRLAFGVCAVLFALAVGLFAFRTLYGDRIYPAVVVGDVEVGGLTRAQAENRLNERASGLDQHGVTFTFNGQTWTPTLSELGVTVDVEGAISRAYDSGRTGDAVDRLAFTGDILQADQKIPLRSTLDTTTLNAWFDKVDTEINQFAIDATLVVSGTNVSISPEATGTVVDREAATQLILQTMRDLTPHSGELPTMVDHPTVVTADLEPSRAQLANSLGSHIRVDFGNNSWRIEPETMAQYLVVSQSVVDGKAKVDIAVDEDALSKYLRQEFASEVNRAPVNATVGWKDGTGLIATSESSDGTTMKPGEFAAAVAASFLGDHERVDIPVIVTKPQIDQDNLETLKIDGLIGRGESNYDGSSDSRATNIGVGVQLLNGTMIGPGEEFSFNGAIGEITEDKGYVESSVVQAERVGKDIGGGICQVSTTVFRAALKSGMTISEWNPHTYRISNYEYDGWNPGFDASILQPDGVDPEYWGDLKFVNNTDGYILIQSWTDYPYVVVEVYGHDDGRTVEIYDEYVSDPIPAPDSASEVVDEDLPPGSWEVSEYALEGLEASFMYKVTGEDGSIIAEKYFYTYFKERGVLYKVSPDMVGQSPAG